MNKKDTEKADSSRNLGSTITFRVSDVIFDELSSEAKARSCTVGSLVRSYIESGKAGTIRVSDKETSNRIMLSVKGMRGEFRRLADAYEGVAATYRESLHLCDRSGRPVLNNTSTLLHFRNLEAITKELETKLNRFLHDNGCNEIYRIFTARMTDEERILKEREDDILEKYSYMEKLQIIGRLTEDASTYKTSAGQEKVRMKACCQRTENGKKAVREYSVFFAKTDVLPHLKTGARVYAEGAFNVNDKGQILLFANELRLCSEE